MVAPATDQACVRKRIARLPATAPTRPAVSHAGRDPVPDGRCCGSAPSGGRVGAGLAGVERVTALTSSPPAASPRVRCDATSRTYGANRHDPWIPFDPSSLASDVGPSAGGSEVRGTRPTSRPSSTWPRVLAPPGGPPGRWGPGRLRGTPTHRRGLLRRP